MTQKQLVKEYEKLGYHQHKKYKNGYVEMRKDSESVPNNMILQILKKGQTVKTLSRERSKLDV